jgi:hypothetical protein
LAPCPAELARAAATAGARDILLLSCEFFGSDLKLVGRFAPSFHLGGSLNLKGRIQNGIPIGCVKKLLQRTPVLKRK